MFQGSKPFANGWFFKGEGLWYNKICKGIFNGNILEVGSFEGLSLSYIKNTIISNNNKIYSVDIKCRPRLVKNAAAWGINLICKSSEDASLDFPDNFFNFIYIDANHSYKSVKKDIIKWLPKLKKTGIIGGHDYNWEGVRKAVNEIFRNRFRVYGRNWIVFPKSKLLKVL